MKRFFVILVLVLLLTGCGMPGKITPSSDPTIAAQELRGHIEGMGRLDSIMTRMSVTNAQYCPGKIIYANGVRFMGYDSAGEYKSAWAAATGHADKALYIVSVVKGSPADRAGLKADDAVLSIDGKSVTKSDGISYDPGQRGALFSQSQNTEFLILRGGQQMTFKFSKDQACDFKYAYIPNKTPNALTGDKGGIYVFSGLVDYFKSDDDLAVMLGHEMAHSYMEHIKVKKERILTYGVLDAMIQVASMGIVSGATSNPWAVQMESEADYIGLYFMARAGYDIDKAPDFWSRLDAISPRGKDHPTGPQRYAAVGLARDEIKAKQAKGAPLVPEIKIAN